jgi:hypothetical protein
LMWFPTGRTFSVSIIGFSRVNRPKTLLFWLAREIRTGLAL